MSVRKLTSDQQVIELFSIEGYVELMESMVEFAENTNEEDENEGIYAALLSIGIDPTGKDSDVKNIHVWAESHWRRIVTDTAKGVDIQLINIIVADTIEEIMGCDEVLDRYNELSTNDNYRVVDIKTENEKKQQQ